MPVTAAPRDATKTVPAKATATAAAGQADAPAPPPMQDPVPLWVDGAQRGEVDAAHVDPAHYVVVDLGDDWAPYIFTDGKGPTGTELPNAFRKTYLALAAGEAPDDHHGYRASKDKYLEVYGIPPTLTLERARFDAMSKRTCLADLDLEPLQKFDGFIGYRNNQRAQRDARKFRSLEADALAIAKRHGLDDPSELDPARLSTADRKVVADYEDQAPRVRVIEAVQKRLECEGFFEGKGEHVAGAMDWTTHEALAELERSNRIFGWGYIGRDTLAVLRRPPLENERESLIRVLTERTMYARGVIENGSAIGSDSGQARSFVGADGKEHALRNLEAELRDAVVGAFGLETPQSSVAWLDGLGDLSGSHRVAIEVPPLPEYYAPDMKLTVEIDRGDVWYDFPFGPDGKAQPQPVSRHPHLVLYTTYRDQKIPLGRFETTIGGWRTEWINGTLMWSYKNSPVGPRVWRRIVAAPVWIPPESTPNSVLLSRDGKGGYEVDYQTMGPGYASAYGLVAAYHDQFWTDRDGQMHVGGDEGIRTHGSVDYMSIQRRNSHGCHRLYNHVAERLMSFVLDHHPHYRAGQQAVAYHRDIVDEDNDQTYSLDLDQGGYTFVLDPPLHVDVLDGRIRGEQKTPIDHPMPKYDDTIGGYVMPDGAIVDVDRLGDIKVLVPAIPDPADAINGTDAGGGATKKPLPTASSAPDAQKMGTPGTKVAALTALGGSVVVQRDVAPGTGSGVDGVGAAKSVTSPGSEPGASAVTPAPR
ncbi:MAG: L,D-transpeptidase [Myxococcales bacterium]|nr:L,D-transpeptidase [Myxococcales bacterium]